jgi:DNA-binding NarL/FixJ family response regulator
VDDQPRARQSLRALLAARSQVDELREAANGVEAILCVEECCPDVVFMDARMPELDGIEATRIIRRESPQVKVIVLSMYPEYRAPALAAGADAFFGKGEPPDELLAMLTDLRPSSYLP